MNIPSMNKPEISELPPQAICETLASALFYPTVIVSNDGFIIYKNESMKKSEYRWRIGASLKYYIGKDNAETALTTKRGDYKALTFEGKNVAVLRLEDYFFLIFLPYLHMTDAHISVLYRYMTSIPEKDFFDVHQLSAYDNVSESFNCFKKKYLTFYQKRYSHLEETNKLYVLESGEYRHELYHVLKTLTKVVNSRKHLIGCEILFNKYNVWNDFWFKCKSEDMGVLMSTVLYLCMIFSETDKTKIEINMERFSFEEISRVTFSFKSNMSAKDVEKTFLNGDFSDERVVYYYTAKCLAFKYFWGFDACKNGDKLEFSLILHEKPVKDSWFFDAEPVTSDFVAGYFEEFFSMLLDEAPDKISD